ncbi:MAG: Gfo/Idh/MocA family oxidoreductase [Kiritimatiellia bacterium]
MKKVGFIQVGTGRFGQGWLRNLTVTPGVEVKALVDIDEKAVKSTAERNGYDSGICHTSLKSALKNAEADAVLCVTPPNRHRQTAVTAMRAGLHVLTEKPMADTPANCRTIVETAKEEKRICAVSQQYRYDSAAWTMAKIIREGRIGRIGQIKVDFFMGHPVMGFRQQMAHPLLNDMSIHHFDLIRFVTGADPLSVIGSSWRPSWSHFRGDCSCSMVFKMTGGVNVIYNGSWCAQGRFCDWAGNWLVEGEKGTLRYDNGRVFVSSVGKGYKEKSTREITPKPPRRGGQFHILYAFLRAVRGGPPPETRVEDNINSIGMVFAAVKAARTERRVKIEA